MDERRKRKHAGAPLGNQNARKNGFYSRYLLPEQQKDVLDAASFEDIESEIKMVRAKISSIVANTPENHRIFIQAVNLYNRLVRTRDQMRKTHTRKNEEIIADAIRQQLSELFQQNNPRST